MDAAYEGLAGIYDRLNEFDMTKWADYIVSLLRGCGNISSVADICCGTGDITLRLAKRGYRLTGVDISSDMLLRARERAAAAGMNIPFICQDIRALRLHRPVDAVISTCDGFNYLLEDADLEQAFAAVYGQLAPGGAFLFDISTAHKLQSLEGVFARDDIDTAYIWGNRYDEKTRICTMDIAFFVKKRNGDYRRFDETHIQKGHDPEVLLSLLRSAGFAAEVHPFMGAGPLSGEEDRIQFICKKGK